MSAATMNEMERVRESAKEVIYLIPDSDEGRLIYLWSDDPAPSGHHVRDEAVEYIRKDIHDAHADMLENRGDELQIMLANVKRERDAALERAAQSDVFLHVLESTEVALEETRAWLDDARNAATAYKIERDAALEREAALAAHVEQLRGALRPLAYGGASDCIARGDFSVMRERVKDWLGVRDFKNARTAFDSTPTTSLTRRDLIRQAEALESIYKQLENDTPHDWQAIGFLSAIRLRFQSLRQRAAQL